ncbi:Lecithin:cholesterol/phospholipid:diacylglycerol acyltransferase [Dillenia turbinata]|uniref:Lecithin:cholesterol/phospholipid:diacylglycerol acyltransferase n=1 Tax=Dillenia turbinata TaxID=194707 RepID=A0AAN8UIL9_9MAGN
MPSSFPQYVTERITGPLPDPPGEKLSKEGLQVKHPVVFVPGIVTGGVELWDGHPCADGLFRKRLWGGTFGEVYKRPLCWVDHMSLDNETGLDPPGVRVRPVSGLVVADYFAPGYFVWANTEVRDQTLSRIKSNIELMLATNGGRKAVIVPHSMGVLYFLHFIKWAEAPAPMGGGGGPNWCANHIKAVMNIGGLLLGVPKAVSALFSAEAKDIAVARAIAPNVLDKGIFGLQTLQHMIRMSRTWDSTMSMLPEGGDIIWGNLDWSPDEGYNPNKKKQGAVKGRNVANTTCRDVQTEYHDMDLGELKLFQNTKFTLLDQFWTCFILLPNAPEMEIFSLYRVGIPTERAYVYKMTQSAECYIPFQIDTSAVDADSCLKDGVYLVDGDETVPALSAGFMCAKGWRGKTRFNPSGIRTYIREYDHAPPATLLEGRGTQSGAHVDIVGNFALIKDIIRVAAGATGKDLGGDQVYSDIFKWSEKINLQL